MNNQFYILASLANTYFKAMIIINNVKYYVNIPQKYRFLMVETKKTKGGEVIGVRAKKISSHKGKFFKAQKYKNANGLSIG